MINVNFPLFLSLLINRVIPLVLMLLVSLIAQAQEPKATYIQNDSIIGRLLDQNGSNHVALYPYESNYIIHTYTSNINRKSIGSYSWAEHARKNETKFQISLGFPIYRGIFGENSVLAAAYTQQSWWQSLNSDQSAPFRETNYQPQIFVGFLTDYQLLGWQVKDIEFGFAHQSNGREKATSRSWNRLYARTMATNGNFLLGLKLWYRLPEDSADDDNPQITRYLGYHELTLGYGLDKSMFTLRSRYNINSGYGSAELGWSYPLNDSIRIYAQLFSGYGESMIDYNYKQTRFGLGVMLNDLF
jgi:phospholipase A1/A2